MRRLALTDDGLSPALGAAGVLALLVLVRPSLSATTVGVAVHVVDAVLAVGGVLFAVSVLARGPFPVDPDRVAVAAWLAVFGAVLGYGAIAVVETARTEGLGETARLLALVSLGVGGVFLALLTLALALDRRDATGD